MTFVLAFLGAIFNPATGALIVYLTGTVIALRTWPPQRPARSTARAMARRQALLAVVKARWAA